MRRDPGTHLAVTLSLLASTGCVHYVRTERTSTYETIAQLTLEPSTPLPTSDGEYITVGKATAVRVTHKTRTGYNSKYNVDSIAIDVAGTLTRAATPSGLIPALRYRFGEAPFPILHALTSDHTLPLFGAYNSEGLLPVTRSMGAWNLLLFPILTDMVLTVALPPIDAVLLTGAASADAGVTAFDVAKDIGHTVVVGGAVLGDVALLTGAAAVDAARFSVTAPIEYTRGLFHTSGAIEPEDLGILSSSPIELDSGDASTFSLTAGDSVSLPFAFQAGSLAVDAEALSKIVVDVIQERGQQAPTIRLSLQSKSTPALRANSVISLATLVEGIAHQKNTKSATAARLFLEEVVRETASESVHASAVAAFRQLGVSVAVSEDELDLQFASNRSIYGIAPDGAYVDWASPQHMVRPPMPRLQMDLAGSLATNSKLTVFLTVYNDGDGDLFRVAANLKSDLRDFDGRRILFGRVPARSHIRRSFAGDIPTTLDGSSDPRLEVAIEEGNGFTPDPIARLLAIRRVLPAQLEHTLEVLDDGHFGSLGNGNGILDPRETAAIILHVRNDGDATAENIRLDGQVNCDLSDVSLFPLVQSNLEKAVSCSTSDCKFSCEIPILERGRVQAIGFLVSLKKSFRGKGVPIALRIRYDHGVTREWPVDNVPVGADRPERPYQFSPERHARVKNENSSLPLVATPSRQGLVLLTVESGSIHKVLAWLGDYYQLQVLNLEGGDIVGWVPVESVDLLVQGVDHHVDKVQFPILPVVTLDGKSVPVSIDQSSQRRVLIRRQVTVDNAYATFAIDIIAKHSVKPFVLASADGLGLRRASLITQEHCRLDLAATPLVVSPGRTILRGRTVFDGDKELDIELTVVRSQELRKVSAFLVGANFHAGMADSRFLKYAEKDVEDFADYLRKSMEQAESLTVTVADSTWKKRDLIEALEQAARRVGPEDTFLVFMSGHGYSGSGGFYFTIRTSDQTSLQDTAISVADLKSALSLAPYSRRILIIDACRSGQLSADHVRELVTCADAVILSSHADELSYESEKLGNGLFTYALLNCLAGAADTDGDHVITAGELGPMLEKKLGDLTKQLRFPSQKPLVVALRDSFVISVVKDQLKK